MRKHKIFALFALFVAASVFARTGVVVWDKINLREGPGTKYKTVRQFERGKYFEVLGRKGNWVEVNANGQTGFFYKTGIKEVKTLGIYTVRPEGVIFLWGPGEHYDTLALSDGGVDVEVVWAKGSYLFGQFNGSGVWLDSSAVIAIRPVEDDLEQATFDEVPEMPEVVVPPVEAPPKVIPEPPKQIVYIPAERPRKRLSVGALPFVKASWIHSKAVDPEKDLVLPVVKISDEYRQTIIGVGLRGELALALDKQRRLRACFLPSAEWSPKRYLLDIYNQNHELTENYLAFAGRLGLSYEAFDGFTIALAGGPEYIGHTMNFGLADSSERSTLHDQWYLAPSALFELRYGTGHVHTVLGATWTRWISENTRFFVKEDGQTVPVGEDIARNSYEVFFGVQLSN